MEPLIITNTITINAPAAIVWDALVNPEQTKKYMFGCETVSDWQVGSSLIWRMDYEGKEFIAVKGNIVKIEPDIFLAYTVIDPNNPNIEDIPENYLTVTYSLHSDLPTLQSGTQAKVSNLHTPNDQTILTVTQGDYNTVADGEKRYKDSYNGGEGWNPILLKIKEVLESNV
ncbi:MAG: SRPBCC domain-containing protein [Bacteroidota bacterium]|nr:SRPBCC domain-containing protein [Bacteroidota bacterium]